MMMMMNVSTVDNSPLVLNYSTFRFISLLFNNLFTWLAAVTFWKFKTRSPKPELLLQLPDPDPDSDYRPDPVPCALDPASSSVINETACIVVPTNGGGCDDVDGVRKGKKFTVYYYDVVDDDDVECCENDDVLGVDDDDDGELLLLKWGEREGGGCELVEWRESLLRWRMGEKEKNGWYTRQDLTVFNGNVVKLWDADDDGFRFGCESRRSNLISRVHLCY